LILRQTEAIGEGLRAEPDKAISTAEAKCLIYIHTYKGGFMKQIGGEILVGAPHSEQRYLHAKHICADCLESAPKDLEFYPYSVEKDPIVIMNCCSICEWYKCVAIVKVSSKQP
jgi:hypothetical protein